MDGIKLEDITLSEIPKVQPSYNFSDRGPGIIKAYTMAHESRMNRFQTATAYVCVTAFWRVSGVDGSSYIFNLSILTGVQTEGEIIFPNSA